MTIKQMPSWEAILTTVLDPRTSTPKLKEILRSCTKKITYSSNKFHGFPQYKTIEYHCNLHASATSYSISHIILSCLYPKHLPHTTGEGITKVFLVSAGLNASTDVQPLLLFR